MAYTPPSAKAFSTAAHDFCLMPNLLIAILLSVGLCWLSESVCADQVPADLRAQQSKIKQVVQRVRPCVVAIEGGSGVVVSPDGFVLSVSHVTKTAGRKVQVRVGGDRLTTATTLGSDPNSDASALKLEGPGPWPFLPVEGPWNEDAPWNESVASSDSRRLGEVEARCLLFGYPLSFRRDEPAVVRFGRVTSSTPDKIVASTTMMGGDSGGPLVDDGLVLIGIASRVKLDVGENIFVPLEQYRKSWTTIAAGETAAARTGKRKAWLGILGDTDEQRVRVRRVQAESPAAEAGLQAEDVIVTLDGQEIKKFTDVIERLREKRPNESLVIGLNRFGRLLEKSVTLGTR